MDRPLLWLNISVTLECVAHHFCSESNIFIIVLGLMLSSIQVRGFYLVQKCSSNAVKAMR